MSGESQELKGRLKEAAGTVTGDRDLEREGKVDRTTGTAKQKVDDAKEKIDDSIDRVKERFERD